MKILTVLGARPQFIKAATVSRTINRVNADAKDAGKNEVIKEIIVHTGQHFDKNMSDVFFSQLDIPQPNYNLGVSGLGHGAMTGQMLESIESLIIKHKPSWVLVYGDTNSTLAGALAAVKQHIPVAHVEAGLRSNNPNMPEEINRVVTDRISSLLFCPTKTSEDNLLSEGFPFTAINGKSQKIEIVGDVMYEAVNHYRELSFAEVAIDRWGLTDKEYALCTLHRQENTDDATRLRNILTALNEITDRMPVVLPLHPRTQKMVDQHGLQELMSSLTLLPPLPYLEMQRLQVGAQVILTDSGGVQKEAHYHQVPCITLRDETEWKETIDSGWNVLVGACRESIVKASLAMAEPRSPSSQQSFGDPEASRRIVDSMLAF